MNEQLANLIITKLEPAFYTIGMVLVFVLVTFGGTLFSLWWRTRERQSDKLLRRLEDLELHQEQVTLSLVRIETKLDLTSSQHEKDLNGIGAKLRNLQP